MYALDRTFNSRAPIFGTPSTPKDEGIITAPHDVDPADAFKLVSSKAVKAIIIPPANRADFMAAAANLGKVEIAEFSDDVNGTLYTKYEAVEGDFLHEQTSRLVDFIKAANRESHAFFQTFIAPIGELGSNAHLHTDREVVTAHLSIRGAPLQYLATHMGNDEIKDRLKLTNGVVEKDPLLIGCIENVKPGDLVLFNDGFWHRASALSMQQGQFNMIADISADMQ